MANWSFMPLSRALGALAVLGAGCAGLLGAYAVHTDFVHQRNIDQLTEMNEQLLRRAELAIDYAVITLGDADLGGLLACTDESVRPVRERIIRRGSIKEIELRDAEGKLSCSGLGLLESPVAYEETPGYVARNKTITLSAQNAKSHGLLRVAWRPTGEFAVAAIINVDTLMFDVFPAALRDAATATVRLAGGEQVAGYAPETPVDLSRSGAVFEATSPRYPVTTQIVVDESAMSKWNAGSQTVALSIGAIIGGVVGLFAARQLSRPSDPVAKLKSAIDRGEIQPYFQPIFALSDKAIVGCEMLLRWVKPDGTVIGPDRFIPLAESSGLISVLTEKSMRAALERLKPLLKSRRDFKVSFNVTPGHFTSNGFASTLCELAHDAGVARRQIVIELTERQSFEDTDRAASVATEVRALGFRLALDDTGSGHNGLSHVQGLPIDIIKIDKKFVDLIGVDQAATSIVQLLVRLAGDLGKTTVAEGIETEAQRLKLEQCGVEEGQGYLVAPALAAENFLALVDRSEVERITQDDVAPALSAA